MHNTLPEPIAAYFAATNRHDVDAMLAPFAAAAVVKDEGRERRGTAAIHDWIKETVEKYRHTVTVLGVEESAGNTVVAGRVAGNFSGSPVDLHYDVTLSGGRISRLDIHP